MHSVAHFILANDPSKKVLYVTSETFTNELIDALKAGKTGSELAMTKFREKYRNNDVLLIDDIQFIIGKKVHRKNSSILLIIFMYRENRLSYQVINPRKISRRLKPVLGQDLSGDLLPISRRLIMRQEWLF